MKKAQFLNTFLGYKNKWYRYAIWVLRDEMDSEDVVQELYFKLWKMRKEMNKYANHEALAFRMLKNLCIDRLRKIKIGKDETQDQIDIPGEGSSSDNLELMDSNEILGKIVASLPETQRLVLQLKNVEGYSVNEIAKQLNMKPNAVNVNLSRARHKIREKYIKWMSYESK